MNDQLIKEQILMLSDTPKRVDAFEVTFHNLPEEISGFLSRQIKQISRPSITFAEEITRGRGEMRYHKMLHSFAPVTAVFFDDENSVVSMALYAQIMRQMNKHYDVFRRVDPDFSVRDYKFDIEVAIKNSEGVATEVFVLKNCFIVEIQHSDPVAVDDAENEITISIAYDNVDVQVFDQMLAIIEKLQQDNSV